MLRVRIIVDEGIVRDPVTHDRIEDVEDEGESAAEVCRQETLPSRSGPKLRLAWFLLGPRGSLLSRDPTNGNTDADIVTVMRLR